MRTLRAQKGFTLVEIIVAMAIFSIFIIATIGSYVTISRIHQRAILQRKALESARLFVDDFTRVGLLAAPGTVKDDQGNTMAPNTCANGMTLLDQYRGYGFQYTFSITNGVVSLAPSFIDLGGVTTGPGSQAVTDNLSNTGSDFQIVPDDTDSSGAPLGDCADPNTSIFKYVVSSSADQTAYLRLRFKIVPKGGGVLFTDPNGIRVVTTVNLRSGEN